MVKNKFLFFIFFFLIGCSNRQEILNIKKVKNEKIKIEYKNYYFPISFLYYNPINKKYYYKIKIINYFNLLSDSLKEKEYLKYIKYIYINNIKNVLPYYYINLKKYIFDDIDISNKKLIIEKKKKIKNILYNGYIVIISNKKLFNIKSGIYMIDLDNFFNYINRKKILTLIKHKKY